MKDLYKRLHISANATENQIRLALENCEEEFLRNDADYVLLNSARRTVYDRNFATLKLIGTLRHGLSLEQTPFWGYEEFRDFTGADIIPVLQEHKPSVTLQAPDWIEKDIVRFFVVFGVLVSMYAFLHFLFFL